MARYDFYNTREWRKLRQAIIARDSGLCQHCRAAGKFKAGREVHHIKEVTDKNCHDRRITHNPDNLTLLCRECHEKTKEFPNKSRLLSFTIPPGD